MSNLHNRYKSAERKISQKYSEYMLNYSLPCSCSYNLSSFWLVLKQHCHWTIKISFPFFYFYQLVNFITRVEAPFLAHLAKGHVSFCHHLASIVRRKLSHLNLLLRNHWANCNQTTKYGKIDKMYSPSVVKINQKSEWKRFLIRKEGKNADLIRKE
jgi:hypothetical protein